MSDPTPTEPPKTLSELVAVHRGAALVFPNGIPKSLPNPNWSDPGYDAHTRYFGTHFFDKWADNIQNIPLDEILKYAGALDLEWLNGDNCYPWFSVWMCGAFYAYDYLGSEDKSHIGLLDSKIICLVHSDYLIVPHDATLYYLDRIMERIVDDETMIVYDDYTVIDKANFASLKMYDRGF